MRKIKLLGILAIVLIGGGAIAAWTYIETPRWTYIGCVHIHFEIGQPLTTAVRMEPQIVSAYINPLVVSADMKPQITHLDMGTLTPGRPISGDVDTLADLIVDQATDIQIELDRLNLKYFSSLSITIFLDPQGGGHAYLSEDLTPDNPTVTISNVDPGTYDIYMHYEIIPGCMPFSGGINLVFYAEEK